METQKEISDYGSEQWGSFTRGEKNEYLEGFKTGSLEKVKSPAVASALKKVFDWEQEFIQRRENNMTDKKEVGTGQEVKAGTEIKTEPKVETAIAVQNGKKEMTLSETLTLGEVLFKSRFFTDLQSAAQCVAKILAGRELGLAPMISISKIFIVNGKMAIQSEIMGDLIKRGDKYNYRIIQLDNQVCELEFFENGKPVGKSKFTMQDAATAMLMTKDVWKKYPRNLLLGRALSNGARWYCPDAIHGAYNYEEMGLEIDGAGQVIPQASAGFTIEGEIVKKDEAAIKTEPKENVRLKEIADLKKKFGEDNLKKVKVKLKIEGKLADISDTDWKKFIEELEAKPEEKKEEPKAKTRDEILEKLKTKHGAEAIRKIKKDLEIEGKLSAVTDKIWAKFVEKMEKVKTDKK